MQPKSNKLALFVLLMLMYTILTVASTNAQVTITQGVQNKHLLLQLEDVLDFGTASVVVPASRINVANDIDPRPLQNWEDGYSTTYILSDPHSGKFTAMVNQASYRFTSNQEATIALASLPDPAKVYGWQSAHPDNEILLEPNFMDLQIKDWRSWTGVDEEGMFVYILWFQGGSYITEIHLNTLEEAIAQTILLDLTSVLLTSKPQTAEISIVPSQQHLPNVYLPTSDSEVGSTDIWIAGARATRFEFPCCWHILGVWNSPQGHSPHFHGVGGDATTCINNGGHGCIGQWNWWLRNPNSKLGIPKSWYSTNFQNGSNNPNNYSATVWLP